MDDATQPQTKNFMSAAMAYFGRLPDQPLAAFRDELHALTQKDREEMAPLLGQALGCTVTP